MIEHAARTRAADSTASEASEIAILVILAACSHRAPACGIVHAVT